MAAKRLVYLQQNDLCADSGFDRSIRCRFTGVLGEGVEYTDRS